ncbi:MAG TPA: PQQ-binding-like beta-propeller repeat protein [Bryobacteraceae bacterium]|nr:PQQ-binding-like beta-propeller repeat protein [Bryobacteraceae bacterium]
MNRRFLLLSSLSALGQKKFADPAPPKVNAPAGPKAVLKANGEVTRHGKPAALAQGAVSEDWPSFLGPTHNGVSRETKLRKQFPPAGPPLVWEMNKGTGYASPAVGGGYLVFLHRRGNQELVECLHPETGERFWQHTYPTTFEDRYGYNNGPRSSPVIDGDRVYTMGAEGLLHCLSLANGQVLWRRQLRDEFKVPQDFFGVASTPLVEGDLLILNIGAPGGPCVIGVDKRTGQARWGAGSEWGGSYASPIPAVVHGKRKIFVFAGGESQPPTGGLLMLDPATGTVDFTFPWRSKSYESVNASCPVIIGNNVFISASYRTGGVMLEITPDFRHKVLWTSRDFGLHFNTPIHKDGFLYGFDGRNEPDASLACVDIKTGNVAWRTNPEWKETFRAGGQQREQLFSTYRGNLLHVDGRFLVLGELGHLLWMDLTPEGAKEGSRAWLFAARETWSLPVLSRGLLYVVQHGKDVLENKSPRLLCYDLRG